LREYELAQQLLGGKSNNVTHSPFSEDGVQPRYARTLVHRRPLDTASPAYPLSAVQNGTNKPTWLMPLILFVVFDSSAIFFRQLSPS
jgi:hypothetical protein